MVTSQPRTCRNPDCRKSLEGTPARQKYCCHSCASSMRKKVMPKIKATQFDALAAHAFYGAKTRTAVRLVLVKGKGQTEVARLTGLSIYSVHCATKRFLAKIAVAAAD